MHNLNTKQLKVIDAIIEHKSATQASIVLGMSIPTVSYILKAVRRITGKSLFTRSKSGLIPDSDAYALQKEYHKRKHFNVIKQKYVISTFASLELPLSRYLNESTQNQFDASFTRAQMSPHKRADALRKRLIDIDIGGKLPEDNTIKSHLFFESDYCVLASKTHKSIDTCLTQKDWNNNHFLQWQRESVDTESAYRYLSEMLQITPKIACKSTNFITLAYICSTTDHLIIAPREIVSPYMTLFPLNIYAMPDAFTLKYNCHVHYHVSMQTILKGFRYQNAWQR